MTAVDDSKRIRALRRELIAAIPRFPNDKASLAALSAKDLADLLIAYIGWRVRFVAARPREVRGVATLESDPRAVGLKPNIDAFVAAVEAGADLTPYLSLQALSRGYTPAAEGAGTAKDRWADKDLLLNVMGFHHFHLGLNVERGGFMTRTDQVLFAAVSRDRFEVLGLFDHAAFEHEDDGSMTPERRRFWAAFEARQAAGLLPGQLSLGGLGGLGITLSSHPVAIVRTADRHASIIREMEPRLDDPAFLPKLYLQDAMPTRPRLNWHYRHLDLGLLDERERLFLLLNYGPN